MWALLKVPHPCLALCDRRSAGALSGGLAAVGPGMSAKPCLESQVGTHFSPEPKGCWYQKYQSFPSVSWASVAGCHWGCDWHRGHLQGPWLMHQAEVSDSICGEQ